MADLAPILPKVEKLVRMLGNENDGEALNAVRLLGRTLTGAGASFHDLAEAIASPPEVIGADVGQDYRTPHPSKRTYEDFVVPDKRKRPPRPDGPPLWERLDKNGRFAWLGCVLRSDGMSIDQKTVSAALRARYFSQPHVQLKPTHAAEINGIFADAWMKDIRPVADLVPGDRRMPLVWTGKNRDDVRRVLDAASPYLPFKDAQYAQSVVKRLEASKFGFALPSLDEIEKIERALVLAYDLGARP